MRDRSRDRLYRLLPDHIRTLDAGEGRPLQALMQILTSELETVERDIDTLYDNWFIETCEDWVVPYLGDLVGARGLREFGQGSLRAYVANTLAYRQGKGTRAILEQVSRDVSGWPIVAVEFFQRLTQSQNVNHIRPGNLATMSLRDADMASQVHGPFESAAHRVEVRSIAKGRGRYNIPHVGLFAWRLQAYALSFAFDAASGFRGGTMPAAGPGPGLFQFDPAGRAMRMFNRARTEAGLTENTREPNLPVALRRRAVAADLRALKAGTPGAGVYFGTRPILQVRLLNALVPPLRMQACDLADQPDGGGGITWKRPAQAGHVLFDPERGRLSLHPADENKRIEVTFAYGRAHDLGGGPYDRRESIESWIEPFRATDASSPLWQMGVTRRTQEHTLDPDQGGPVVNSLQKAIKAWNLQAASGSRGIITLMDDATYDEDLTDAIDIIRIPAGARLAIVAASWPAEEIGGGARQREVGLLTPQDRRPLIASNIRARGTATDEEEAGTLILDGLWIKGKLLVESGDLGRLELNHCSLGLSSSALGEALQVKSGAAGDNERLDIRLSHTITGRLDAGQAAGTVSICDSILGEDQVADGDAEAMPLILDAPHADLVIARATLFGRTKGRSIEADDTIFVAPLDIARRQEGCLRFSYVPEHSRAPRLYRCAPHLQIQQTKEAAQQAGLPPDPAALQAIRERIKPLFVSSFSEHEAFAQLTRRCPPEITEGAEAGREMGAMNALCNPMRLANIRDALDEYLPFGLEAGVIFVN